MGQLVGHEILRFDAVESTNDTAKELLGDRASEGTVIVAERQVAGRGRHGRAWFSPPGGLYCSIVLKSDDRNVPMLNLVSGMPVVKALRHWSVLATLKWPNDVVFRGRKIGGVLCEGVHHGDQFWVVAGIGVNTNVSLDRLPEEVRNTATSLKKETGVEVSNDEFLEYMLRDFDKVYAASRSGARKLLARDYMALCSTIRQKVEVTTATGKVRGTAVEVTPQGALVLVDDAGKRLEVADGTVSDA
ncbi:MAG TPA: biotin--[acetyl-CoA-carboxylase] ligase [Thermoplasmata archaeon]|jgi:BirA family biotin operon repressor/biotin-[acetyl-CoA-carboxylase] ligase|nr:biotin--[acetyl-CoA-carboxylase] ligase [Thermoplasmata archaeon]